ncbi:MAG: FtsQ-type POTRA domain-containing protein [Actinomycetia bacterium]|nr:FtsQ-type POTRA domain-containing protein [Actinomycetes bacterium]
MPDPATGLADLGPVLHVRARRAARRRLRRILVAVLAVAVLAVVAWAVLFSRMFAVQTVEVSGTELLTSDQVIETARVDLGGPLSRVDTKAVETRVAALPEVASVRAHRSWPHTLRLDVTERTALFQRQVPSASAYQWVDAGGVVFHTDDRRLDVPLVWAADDGAAMMGEVATVVTALPDVVRAHLTAITATSRDQITVQLDDGRQIMWGSADQSDLKAQVITVLLNQPGRMYDVSAPGRPAVR